MTALCLLLCPVILSADTLILKSGQQVAGTYAGGDPRSIRFDVGDQIKTFAVSDVEQMLFGNSEAAGGWRPVGQRPQVRPVGGRDEMSEESTAVSRVPLQAGELPPAPKKEPSASSGRDSRSQQVSAGVVAGQTTASSGSRFEGRGAVVYDRKTSLVWQRCSVGQQWSNGRCTGQAQTFTWFAARGLGADGWRLPTSEELRTLIDSDRKARNSPPLINPIFPNTPLLLDENGRTFGRFFWTSSQLSDGNGEFIDFEVDIGGGRGAFAGTAIKDVYGARENRYFVRLVLSIPHTPETEPANPTAAVQPAPFTTANGRYVVQGNEVLDRRTGLIWQRCPSPNQTYKEGLGCTGLAREYTRDEMLNLQVKGWRVPSFQELLTLVDEQRAAQKLPPYIDVTAFLDLPTTGWSPYWSITPESARREQYRCVNVVDAARDACGPSYAYKVRLVRDQR